MKKKKQAKTTDYVTAMDDHNFLKPIVFNPKWGSQDFRPCEKKKKKEFIRCIQNLDVIQWDPTKCYGIFTLA